MQVVSVGYAAVKGTRHLTRPEVRIGPAGVVGDRRWCLVDVEARQVLRTVAHPRLMGLAVDEEPLVAAGAVAAGTVTTGTGDRVTCDYWGREVALDLLDHPLAAEASGLLGLPPARGVRLAAAPERGVVYAGAVSLVALSTVEALAAEVGVPVDPRRFRANLVVDTGLPPRAEEAWVGRAVRVGDTVVRPTALTTRCAVVDHHPDTGARDLRVLAALPVIGGAPVCGADGEVVADGVVRPGDPVEPVGD
ncbi:MOSC domain-containing protein [Nocardioides sp.]|uniref:MOSC domain-containing protein n=1 Tax=Nocardioides sp. TaxID=35761 RepID=UPI00262F04E4|nr:MOSC domain-containing protein [Nocardioides sp.]